MAHTEASRGNSAGPKLYVANRPSLKKRLTSWGRDLGRDALELYTAEAEYFEHKKMGKADALNKIKKRSVSRLIVSPKPPRDASNPSSTPVSHPIEIPRPPQNIANPFSTPSSRPAVSPSPRQGASNQFKKPATNPFVSPKPPQGGSNPSSMPASNFEEPIRSVPKHTVHVQYSARRDSHHGSVSSRNTTMSDFINRKSSSAAPAMPGPADRPPMLRTNADFPSAYQADGQSRMASTSTKQTTSYADDNLSRTHSGYTARTSPKLDSRSVKTRSRGTDQTRSYPAEGSSRTRNSDINRGRPQPDSRPSATKSVRSNRTSAQSGSTIRPRTPCQFCNKPASPSKQYPEIKLHLCSQCASKHASATKRASKVPSTRSLTNPTCRLCREPVSQTNSVVQGSSYLCHPCAARAFHPAPKRSPSDPPCQVCHNAVSPMHAVIEANNYLCRQCADRAFHSLPPVSPMAPPTPLKDPRHRSRSASIGRRSRQASPHTRVPSPPCGQVSIGSTHMSDFDFTSPDDNIIPGIVPPLTQSRASSPLRHPTGPYAGRRIPPPSSVYPDSEYPVSPPPSPPPPMPPNPFTDPLRRPSIAASSIYSTRTPTPSTTRRVRHAYVSDDDAPALPEIHPALRSQFQARNGNVDLSSLVPPEVSKTPPRSAKGKGRSRRGYEGEGEDGEVRDTKFYEFYDEIIPRDGGSSRSTKGGKMRVLWDEGV